MRCKAFWMVLLVFALFEQAAAQTTQAPAGRPATPAVPDTDETRIADLISASHILAARGIIDGRGHVSVRSVKNPSHYFMARMVPPGEVTRSDIVEFDADSNPVTDPFIK